MSLLIQISHRMFSITNLPFTAGCTCSIRRIGGVSLMAALARSVMLSDNVNVPAASQVHVRFTKEGKKKLTYTLRYPNLLQQE